MMIRYQMSAALLILDGFTGRTLGKRVVCKLDGVPLARPVWKSDGWLVLTNLSPGEHKLSLRCPGFQDKEISVSGNAAQENAVIMSPGARYAFPVGTAFLSLTLSGATEAQVFAGMPGPRPLKLTRAAKAGESAVKMFLSGPTPPPGWFLIKDKATEAAFLRRVGIDGEAETASPLASAHSRGATLIPAQAFLVRQGETVRIPFRNAGEATLFCGGTLKTVELRTGAEERLNWSLEG